MMHFSEKDKTPDFSKGRERKAYVYETQDSVELLRKELDVNRQEQVLLQKRIEMMNGFINDLPASDPQYNMMRKQVEMDWVEIDELKIRETLILQKLSK